ncbi:MAG: peptidoglycan-N-acetylglucosamine deacetylase, partial [Oscillospiraceae bacterium]|nr:peptidoglycan-N-acetylglucosamine deacetylase [Oscillospiraceae bacterium]
GIKTTLLRFPGGSSNGVSRFNPGIMTRLTKLVEEKGFQYFDWHVDSQDAGGAKTADEVFQNVVNGVKNRKTSVVLQHDIRGYSVDAVERIIQWGLKNGYTFKALDENSPKAHHNVKN